VHVEMWDLFQSVKHEPLGCTKIRGIHVVYGVEDVKA
jgi:hypothetical protein